MTQVLTRMGDGYRVEMSLDEIRQDLQVGTDDAAMRGKIAPLSKAELEHLLEIVAAPDAVVGVRPGDEIVTTSDSGSFKITYQSHIPMDRSISVLVYERVLGTDSVDIGNIDYSYKAVKPIMNDEAKVMEFIQANAVIPVLYGSMPNLGLYTRPDGPVPNWAELLPMGKIDEARLAQEEAVEHAVKDMVYVAGGMYEAGADGINLDSCGASGDADFLASLLAAESIKEKYPDLGIELGMAGEFVLGMHGKLTYKGERLAGMYPHQQVKMAEAAGVSIYGPVVNTNSNKSLAWNLSRTVTFIKACTEVARIPVHCNVGMGVGATPMSTVPAADAVSRVVKALVELGGIDGL